MQADAMCIDYAKAKTFSIVCLCFISNQPVPHCIPVHPTAQVQVLRAVQVPPFWQVLVQVAVVGEGGMTVCRRSKKLMAIFYSVGQDTDVDCYI